MKTARLLTLLTISFLTIFALRILLGDSQPGAKQAPSTRSSRAEPGQPAPGAHHSDLGLISISGAIRYGESLWDIFRKHSIPREEALSAIQAMEGIFNPRRLKAGKRYTLLQDTLRNLVAYRYQPDLTTVYEIFRDSTGSFRAAVRRKPLVRKIKTLSGSIRTTLYESMLQAGARPELIVNFTDIFQWDVDFFIEPRPGDRYRLVYEEYDLDSSFVRYGRILAAQYVLRGKPLTAFFYQDSTGKSGYYEWSGQSFQKRFLKSPLNYRRISSYFSLGRRHPILKIVRPHYGVDFAAPAGTPVVAPADGVVIDLGYQRGGVGRYLKIRHDHSHFVTLYGHLRGYARGIRKGVRVKQRQVIGYVGSTGLATGPHLHYTFYENGRPIDPLRIRNVSADPLKPEQIPAFHRQVRPWLDLLTQESADASSLCLFR